IEHQEKRGVIEDGTYRSNPDHEPPDVIDIPLPWHREIFLVDVIRWDAHLRCIVQKIVEQHLDGRHREEGKEIAAANDAEHVAKIRTGAHANVFDDVAEYLSALDNAVLQHEKAFYE